MKKGEVSRRFKWEDLTPFPENPPISDQRVDRLRRQYDGYKHGIVGTPEVADNSANAFPRFSLDTVFILDGNNRREIARREKKLDREVICKLWRGLSKAEMHEKCLGGNDRRTPKPAEKFLRAFATGDARRQAIHAAVQDMGWEITYERAEGGFSCTHELEWIWAGGRAPAPGVSNRAALVRAIDTYERAFGRKAQSRQANIVKGFGAFWLLYPDADPDHFADALEGLTVKGLYDAARQRRLDLNLAHLYNGMVDVLRHRYNRGKRGKARLGEKWL